jgi:hypothetical protein
MKRKGRSVCADTLTADQQVLLAPELLTKILSYVEKASLTHLNTVCKLWYWEVAKHLWHSCKQLQSLQYGVCYNTEANVSPFIRNLNIENVSQIWEPGTITTMPSMPNLRSVSIPGELLNNPWKENCVSLLLPSGLKSLKLDMLYPMLGSFHTQSSGICLHNLHQRCHHLRALSLNLNLAPAAAVNLQLLLLSAPLEEVHLGPLLEPAIGDWTVAILLSQERLHVLELHAPVTLRSLQILHDQAGAVIPHQKLDRLTITFNFDDAETMSSLFSRLSNITTLNIKLGDTPDDSLRSPACTVFPAISQLQHLRTLNISIKTTWARDATGERTYNSITGGDLIALTTLPLTSLSIEPHHTGMESPLELQEVKAADLLHALRRWEPLESLTLKMWCKEVICARHQAESILELLFRMPIHYFRIGDFVLDKDELDPNVWLGKNTNFCPDPLEWVPRELYHRDQVQAIECMGETQEEADYLVWGEEPEPQADANPERETFEQSLGDR